MIHGEAAVLGLPLDREETQMRYVVLWALGVPISGLIVLHLLGMI